MDITNAYYLTKEQRENEDLDHRSEYTDGW